MLSHTKRKKENFHDDDERHDRNWFKPQNCYWTSLLLNDCSAEGLFNINCHLSLPCNLFPTRKHHNLLHKKEELEEEMKVKIAIIFGSLRKFHKPRLDDCYFLNRNLIKGTFHVSFNSLNHKENSLDSSSWHYEICSASSFLKMQFHLHCITSPMWIK